MKVFGKKLVELSGVKLKDAEDDVSESSDEMEETQVLNVTFTFDKPCRPGIDRELLKQIYLLYLAHCAKERGKELNLKTLQNSQPYVKFHSNTCELQTFQLSTMPSSCKSSFWINIYNTLVLHLYVEIGVPSTPFSRKAFFNNYKYKIGNFTFSLNDIRHGILRGNPTKQLARYRQLRGGDRRRLFILPLDPRIHFALSSLTDSSPSILIYEPEKFDTQVTQNVSNFLNDHVLIDAVKKEVSTT